MANLLFILYNVGTVKDRRIAVFHLSNHDSFPKLYEKLTSCSFEECSIKESYVLYKKSKRTSSSYGDKFADVTIQSSVNTGLHMRNLRLANINFSETGMKAAMWKCTNTFCKDTLLRHGVFGDEVSLEAFLQIHVPILGLFRNAFAFHTKEFKRTVGEFPEFQGMFRLFWQNCLSGLANKFTVLDVNSRLLSGFFSLTSGFEEINGFSDLGLFPDGTERSAVDTSVMHAMVELKTPYSEVQGLCHSDAAQPKDQTIIETDAMWQSLGDNTAVVKVALTDINVICINVCLPDGKGGRCHLISHREYEPRLFIMKLLLLCCDLTMADFEEVIKDEDTMKVLIEKGIQENSGEGIAGTSSSRPTDNSSARMVTRSQQQVIFPPYSSKQMGEDQISKDVCFSGKENHSFFMHQAHERVMENNNRYYSWQARCDDHVFLSEGLILEHSLL